MAQWPASRAQRHGLWAAESQTEATLVNNHLPPRTEQPPKGVSKDQQIQTASRSQSNWIAEIHEKAWIFFTALRVFNFLCLPPKGFFIDRALGSVGSAVEEKLLMERLVIGDRQGLEHCGDGSEER